MVFQTTLGLTGPRVPGGVDQVGADVMSHDHRGRLAQSLHQADQIADEIGVVIHVEGIRLAALAEAPQIGSHNPVTGGSQGTDLGPPRIPQVGKAMDQDDQWTLPFFDVMQSDTVDVGEFMVETSWIVHVLHSLHSHFVSSSSRVRASRCLSL
jgi:hypothetical protein